MKFMSYGPAQALFDAVLKVGDDPAFKLLDLSTQAAVVSARARATDAAMEVGALQLIVDQARDIYGTDDVEIDDQPVLSVADGGVWVSAWVWVETPEGDGQ